MIIGQARPGERSLPGICSLLPGKSPRRSGPCVYLVGDAEGCLLYVGQTARLKERLRQHNRSAWAPLAACIEFRAAQSPAAARAVERELIVQLRPVFNRTGCPSGPPGSFKDALSLLEALVVRTVDTVHIRTTTSAP